MPEHVPKAGSAWNFGSGRLAVAYPTIVAGAAQIGGPHDRKPDDLAGSVLGAVPPRCGNLLVGVNPRLHESRRVAPECSDRNASSDIVLRARTSLRSRGSCP